MIKRTINIKKLNAFIFPLVICLLYKQLQDQGISEEELNVIFEPAFQYMRSETAKNLNNARIKNGLEPIAETSIKKLPSEQ